MERNELERLAGKPVEITYHCREIGYGVEEGVIDGEFTGEVDHIGKFTFQPDEGAVMYLFPDEVVEVMEVGNA